MSRVFKGLSRSQPQAVPTEHIQSLELVQPKDMLILPGVSEKDKNDSIQIVKLIKVAEQLKIYKILQEDIEIKSKNLNRFKNFVLIEGKYYDYLQFPGIDNEFTIESFVRAELSYHSDKTEINPTNTICIIPSERLPDKYLVLLPDTYQYNYTVKNEGNQPIAIELSIKSISDNVSLSLNIHKDHPIITINSENLKKCYILKEPKKQLHIGTKF